jgi:hypothetical protein
MGHTFRSETTHHGPRLDRHGMILIQPRWASNGGVLANRLRVTLLGSLWAAHIEQTVKEALALAGGRAEDGPQDSGATSRRSSSESTTIEDPGDFVLSFFWNGSPCSCRSFLCTHFIYFLYLFSNTWVIRYQWRIRYQSIAYLLIRIRQVGAASVILSISSFGRSRSVELVVLVPTPC